MTDRCKHYLTNAEGVEWSTEDSVDHFLNCIDDEKRLTVWSNLYYWSGLGRLCAMTDHKEEIFSANNYIMKLRQQLDNKD